eukprot:6479675-Pyramimonas_sp.AAC.1
MPAFVEDEDEEPISARDSLRKSLVLKTPRAKTPKPDLLRMLAGEDWVLHILPYRGQDAGGGGLGPTPAVHARPLIQIRFDRSDVGSGCSKEGRVAGIPWRRSTWWNGPDPMAQTDPYGAD